MGVTVDSLRINPSHDIAQISALSHRKFKTFEPDIVWVGYDRREVVPAALVAFYENRPVFHYGGGSTGSGIWDETSRFVLSRLAHFHYCIAPRDAEILKETGEDRDRIYLVGTTAFDGVTVDEGLCPSFPFDLLLLNPDPQSAQNTRRWMSQALRLIRRPTIAVEPNEDKNREIITEKLNRVNQRYEYVPHGQFLGLLKNCVRAIGNSSSFVYELPYFDARKWVPVGERNRDRVGWGRKIITGASVKMAAHLANVKINPKLLRKTFHLGASSRN